MESISKCCEAIYRYPFDRRKLLLCGGVVLVVLFIIILYWAFASGGTNDKETAGSEALRNVPFIDGFNNLPMTLKIKAQNKLKDVQLSRNLENDTAWGSACPRCKTDFIRLKAGGVHAQFWSAGVDCSSANKDAVSQTLEQIDTIHRMVNLNKNIFFATSDYDIDTAQYYDKIASFITVNGGHSIDGRLGVLRKFYDVGVRSMALTSECNTTWATSYLSYTTVGLNDFGKKVVLEMNRLGMIIDLSGTSYQTQVDVLNTTKAPVIFSHSASFEKVKNERNIKPDVLKKLKENNGIIMVTFEPNYTCPNSDSCEMDDVVDQINGIKTLLGGVENIGIGAAFDNYEGGYPKNLEDVSKYGTLFDRLHKNGDVSLTISELEKIASRNFRRVMRAVEEIREKMSGNDVDESYEKVADFTQQTCYSDFEIRYPGQSEKTTPSKDAGSGTHQ